MANKKITELTRLTFGNISQDDIIMIVDVNSDNTSIAETKMTTIFDITTSIVSSSFSSMTYDFSGKNIASSGNVGIGNVPISNNGLLQFPAGTTKASGIAFDSDSYIYRQGWNDIVIPSHITVGGSHLAYPDASAKIELGGGRTGAGNAYIDFHSSIDGGDNDYDARLIRKSSGELMLSNVGSNPVIISSIGGLISLQTGGSDSLVTYANGYVNITKGGLILGKIDSNAGGRIEFNRSLDNTIGWSVFSYGNSPYPDLNIKNVDSSTTLEITKYYGTWLRNFGNSEFIIDSGFGSTPGDQTSYVKFSSNGVVKGEISVGEGTSGNPIELNSLSNKNVVMVNGGGNVGMGTKYPLSYTGFTCAHINGTNGGVLILSRTDASSTRMELTLSDTYGELKMVGNTPLRFGTNNLERLRINESGNVGIGITEASYKLHVNGTVAGNSSYISLSDRREKENINYSFNYGLKEILALKPVKFDFIIGEKRNIGFIAQDVEEVIPEIISTFTKNGQDRLAIKESSIIPVLVKAIQELTNRIYELEKKK